MNTIIRQETPRDKNAVYELIKKAFENEEFSDHDEHNLVEHLRKSDKFVKKLSLVAETEQKIVGYILFTEININFDTLLALAPVVVIPELQKKGIGSQLITQGHKIAKSLGYKGCVVLGHPDYYPRFGYIQACNYSITAPFDIEDKYFMVLEFEKGSLKEISGIVEYAKEFFENSK